MSKRVIAGFFQIAIFPSFHLQTLPPRTVCKPNDDTIYEERIAIIVEKPVNNVIRIKLGLLIIIDNFRCTAENYRVRAAR